MKSKSLSIVCSMYLSRNYLREFHERMTKTAKDLTTDYEIVFVDDGSPDDSADVVRSIIEKDNHVRLVVLSRNFGHFKATLAGIAEATGDLVFMTNCDLEEPPEILSQYCARMFAGTNQDDDAKVDLVYGFQKNRKGNVFSRTAGALFYRVLNRLAGMHAPQNQVFSSLMSRRYVEALLLYTKEEHILLMGIMQLTGFRQEGLGIEKSYKGTTSYHFRHKIAVSIDAMTSFSSKPLLAVSFCGVLMMIPAGIFVGYIVIHSVFYGGYMVGWASLIASIWLVGGMCIASIGLVGIYVGKIFTQVKQRPAAIVKEYVNRKKSGEHTSNRSAA
jgi:putative glycosyltransferase